MARLCLCLNQIARVRSMKKGRNPDPVAIAIAAEMAGIDGIVVQMTDERSDITERDVTLLKQVVQTHFNIAVPANEEMVNKTLTWKPDMVTLMPGVTGKIEPPRNPSDELPYIEDMVQTLRSNNIVVTLLIEPDAQQIRAAARAQVDYVQFDTSTFAGVEDLGTMTDTVEQIRSAAITANKIGLGISVGRGLSVQTARELADIDFIEEYNVGWAIVSRAMLVGIEKAIRDFKSIIEA
jgi:pyridoxine 5-phosphate synthase